MRILFVAASHPESAWLYKALQESAHSLQRAEDVRDGAFLTTQEPFDAIIVMALDASSYAGLLETLPQFVTAGAGAAIIAVLGHSNAQDRSRVLRVRTELRDRGIAVMVADTGPGIDPSQLTRIFTAFVTTKPHGMGLGLAICQMNPSSTAIYQRGKFWN